jgi:putative aldouronate transport system permease protein
MVLYPLYFIIIASISDPSQVSLGRVSFFPKGITLAGYKKVVEYDKIWVGYRNTILYVVGYTSLSVLITLMTGYAMSRKSFPGKKPIMIFMIITMFFSGGLIPTYLLVDRIGLIGKPIIIILMGSVNVYNIIIARTFMKTSIPEEIYEAASIDGCRHFQFFWYVVLRLSPALIAILTLFAIVSQWNSWFNAMIYLRNENHVPLQLVLREIIISQSTFMSATDTGSMMGEDTAAQALLVESMKYAVIIVSTLPIMCLYPFVQKYFVKGIMIGSIKG